MDQIKEELPMLKALLNDQHMLDNSCYSRDYVEIAKDYIHANLKTVTVDSLAKHIGINRSYLTKIFTDKTGLSPMSYITKKRMELAVYYLMHTNWMIREVAKETGYKDPLHFSKVFKNNYGIGPKEYRKGVEPDDHFKAS
ncbi:MAG: AraC family transcriptional regulator [Lachnospiraceae bacterium]|nr:AraC family transcriptional regulator [Lachnospiraceae bacterium]